MISWFVVAWVLLPFFIYNAFVFTVRLNGFRQTLNVIEICFLTLCWLITALCLGIIV